MSSEETREIKTVYVFENGMVAVFDTKGQQWPDLQGEWEEKRTAIDRQIANQSYKAEFHTRGRR